MDSMSAYTSDVFRSTSRLSVSVYSKILFLPYFRFNVLLYQSYIRCLDKSKRHIPTYTDLFSFKRGRTKGEGWSTAN